VPIVQWIELQIPVLLMGVRIPLGTQKSPGLISGLFYASIVSKSLSDYLRVRRFFRIVILNLTGIQYKER